MSKTMLVNVAQSDEHRIAIMDSGKLENYFAERAGQAQIVGNIYKAKVVNIEQSLQCAFVDFGGERQGFLHLSDIAPHCYQDKQLARRQNKGRVDVTRVLKRGQEILIQVTKEGIRNKAPAVTTFLSLAGRYLVLMPYVKRHGVSRKIDNEEERDELREALESLNPPKEVGVIIRTAAAGRGKRDLHRDLNYLLRLWQGIQKRAKKDTPDALLYEESDLVIRVMRDVYSSQFDSIIVDDEAMRDKITDFMTMAMRAGKGVVTLHKGPEPLFTRYHVEEQIERIHRNRVPLDGGGSIVIEQTEALVAIDVNSGRFKRESNAEETAYRINLQAAEAIGRQLQLRDLGGLIICDFIDMRDESHKRDVERKLWEMLKSDRARTKMLRMSRFGIIEMTRQRIRRNIESTDYQRCATCSGRGVVRNPASIMLDALRRMRSQAAHGSFRRMVVKLHPEILVPLQNEKRTDLAEVEDQFKLRIILEPTEGAVDNIEIKCYKT